MPGALLFCRGKAKDPRSCDERQTSLPLPDLAKCPPQTVEALADFRKAWEGLSEGRSLIQVTAPVGLLLFDNPKRLELRRPERSRTWGPHLWKKIEFFIDGTGNLSGRIIFGPLPARPVSFLVRAKLHGHYGSHLLPCKHRRQGKGFSLPTQAESCRKYAAEKGYRIVGEFQDMHTGTELDRPGLNALYEFVEKDRVDILLVHDIDRLTREVGNQAIIEMELGNAGVRIEYVIGQYGRNDEGELMKLVKSGVAQYENRQRVKRSAMERLGRAKPKCGLSHWWSDIRLHLQQRKPQGLVHYQRGGSGGCSDVQLLVEDGLTPYAIAKYLWESQILAKGIIPMLSTRRGTCGWDSAHRSADPIQLCL